MPNNILITPGSASIQFSGSAANTIRLQVEPSGSVAFYGNSGSLFGITDLLSGSLMSVNDISGLPILEVFSDDRVVMGSFNKNTLVVTGSAININATLAMTGSARITGSLILSGSPGPELTVIGDSIFTGSVVMSGSGQPELIVIGDAIITGSLVLSGSTLPELRVVGDVGISGSVAVTGSMSVIGDSIFTGSVVISGSTQPELRIIGDAIITGSLTVTEQIILPVTSSTSPRTGSMFYSSSFFYVYDGTQYRSASLV